MSPRNRILMLEPNRYRALLLQRALLNRFPETIVVRFDATEPVLEELRQSEYAGAIVNLDTITVAQTDRLTSELQDCPATAAIFQVSPETPRKSVAATIDVADSVLMSASSAPDDIANQLALRILSERSEPSDEPTQTRSNAVQLTLTGK